jgi:tRNA (uracil-5-)-methyltransferase
MPLSRIQPDRYRALLDEKVSRVCKLLHPFLPPQPQIVESAALGFRQRAEFRMWHDGDALDYVMYRPGEPKHPIAIEDFPIASDAIRTLMPTLKAQLRESVPLREKLFQVEFLGSLTGEILVSLIYHRALDDNWEQAARHLAHHLNKGSDTLSIIGRSRGQKLIIGRDFVQERLPIHDREYRYRQYEQAFSQPNGQVNIRMVEWACERARALQGDLLELYCGNGNFTLPLSRHFQQVIATEVSKTSIRAARANVEENHIRNVQMLRMSAEEVSEALRGVRTFRRLAALPQRLDRYNLNTLFLDPPRAGLDEKTTDMAKNFSSILYVSCNPDTLAKNLYTLHKTHTIEHFALFDQFPYTDHMECGVLLQQRQH